MGKLNSAGDAFSGLVGPVVMSSWKGIKYLKHKGRKPKTSSEKQLQHRAKVALVSKFVYSMKELLEITFRNYAVKKTGTNAAFSYNFKNATSGVFPDLGINYSLVRISRGDLPNVSNAKVINNGNGQLKFMWDDNSGTGLAKKTDQVLAVVYFPENNYSIYSTEPGKREAGELLLSLPPGVQIAETWIVSMDSERKEIADSVYAGKVML